MTQDTFVWPVRDKAKGTWFGSEELKAWCLARMVKHREHDEIVQGVYQEESLTPSGYRGCLIGCTLPKAQPPLDNGLRELWSYLLPGGERVPQIGCREDDVENLYGIRYEVGVLLESTFEFCAFDDAAEFAVASIEAIPVGVVYPDPDDLGIDPYETAVVLKFLRTEGVPA